MRITQNTLTRQLLYDINMVTEKMSKTQSQVASGQRIERPSDDPVVIPQLLAINSDIADINQYKKNIQDSMYWLEASELSLEKTEDAVLEVASLGNQGLSALLSSEERDVLRDQVNQYLEDLLSSANSTNNGKYLFGGTQTASVPFIAARNAQGEITAVTQNPAGIEGQSQRIIGPNQTFVINSNGASVFQPNGSGASQDLFDIVISIRDALDNDDLTTLETKLGELDTGLNTVLQESANVGTKINRLQFAQDRFDMELLNNTAQQSEMQDTDYIEVMLKYQSQQNVYQTALQMGANLLQQSLVNYI